MEERARQKRDARAKRRTHALKLVIVAVNVPSLLSAIVPEVSMVCAMFVLPHGFAVEGRWTSLRWGVPLTPSSGAIAACACAWRAAPRRTAATARMFLEKSMAEVGEKALALEEKERRGGWTRENGYASRLWRRREEDPASVR